MWFWPSLLQDALGPSLGFGLGDDAMVTLANHSSCRINFISYSAPIQNSKSSGPAPGDDSSAVVDNYGPVGEAMGFELDASPFNGVLSVSYGRNLFRGQTRMPVQSEWSKIEYHKYQNLPSERPESVRVDLQGSISVEGTIGWMVKGTRAVGNFSRVGVGIGVQGSKGLVLSLSWSRLGQSLNLPIVVCPLDLVNVDIIAASIAIPWTVYAAFHYGVIQPTVRRRHKAALSQKQKELEALVQDRKAESRKTIELMTAPVQRRQAAEKERNGLVILEAQYAVFRRSRNEQMGQATTKPRSVDVTIPVAGLVHKGQLVIARGVDKVSDCCLIEH